jgi:hypothetical protein
MCVCACDTIVQPAVEDMTVDFAFEIVISARVYFIVASSQQVRLL